MTDYWATLSNHSALFTPVENICLLEEFKVTRTIDCENSVKIATIQKTYSSIKSQGSVNP